MSKLSTLAEIVKNDEKRIPAAVKHWVEKYERNSMAALGELLMLLFEVILFSWALSPYLFLYFTLSSLYANRLVEPSISWTLTPLKRLMLTTLFLL